MYIRGRNRPELSDRDLKSRPEPGPARRTWPKARPGSKHTKYSMRLPELY